jgi:hypothetical protein
MRHARDDYNGRIIDSAGIIPEDEPVFLLRAQDPIAASIVRAWANAYMNRIQMGMGGDPAMARLATEHADAMDAWPIKKSAADLPDGVQSPRLPGVPRPEPRKNGDQPTPEDIYGPGPATLAQVRYHMREMTNSELEDLLDRMDAGTSRERLSEYAWFHKVQPLWTEAQGMMMHPTIDAHVRSVITERLANMRKSQAGRR